MTAGTLYIGKWEAKSWDDGFTWSVRRRRDTNKGKGGFQHIAEHLDQELAEHLVNALNADVPKMEAKLREMVTLMPEIKSLLSFLSWESSVTKAQAKRIHDLLAKIEKWEKE